MRLESLIDRTDMKIYGNKNVDVWGLSDNSLTCKPGDIFFAISGTKVDAKEFALDAVKRGAVAVVSNVKLNLPKHVANVVCKNDRKAMSYISASFYGFPSKELFIVGVTGTNGKTTSTFMLESIFKNAGKKVGIIGTNGVFVSGEKIVTNMTTPDPIVLQNVLAIMRDNGVQVVCMEISAHALELQKNWGVMTDIALFTNLTQDHLDFFLNMQNYYKAKAKLFTPENAIIGVVNVDDKFGKKLYKESKIPMLTYSLYENSRASIFASEIFQTENGQTFNVTVLGEKQEVNLKLSGLFNISNALASIGAGFIYGLKLDAIISGLEKLEEVDGRFNCYDINGIKAVIDYAHTPDGLENILKSAKQMSGDHKLYSVFGCGGNRDSLKRPIMGKISEELAEFTIITSDNPRFEKPEDIAKDIESGMKKSNHTIIIDRESAIFKAFSLAKAGDVIVISGKGSENYIDQNGEKRFYQDKNVVMKIKKQISGNN